MSEVLRILFVGEGWQGSSARSMREALARIDRVLVDDMDENRYVPRPLSLPARVTGRVLKNYRRRQLEHAVVARVASFRPQVLLIYKGSNIGAGLIKRIKQSGVLTINVFPDYSPHAYGPSLQAAVGEYDLVISTKPFHPDGWSSIYGYSNRCVLVPHGYDPEVHLWTEPSCAQDLDVVMAATWRPEYDRLLAEFAERMDGEAIRVGLAGLGWDRQMHRFPRSWEYAGIPVGRAYGQFLRRGKIAVAPLNTEVSINGVSQPGDQDTTRTYELAAANCFFLHKRTPFAQGTYDECKEVPMWDSATELAEQVRHYLPLEHERRAMAAAAHARAVPAYSIPSRARQIVDHVRAAFESGHGHD